MGTVTLVCITLTSLLASYSVKCTDPLNQILFNGNYEFIDLTHPFDNNTVYWQGTQPFKFTKVSEGFRGNDKYWYAANEFTAGEHGGTHIDAPYHFSSVGQFVGDIPLEKLIAPIIIADVSSKVNDNPDFVLFKHHLDFLINDNLGKPCILIFKFGWSKYFNDRKKYLGLDEKQNTMRFPGMSEEVAEWITSTYKNVLGVGVDVSSVDPGSSTDFAAHKAFAKAGVYNIENVNLDKPIHGFKCTGFALPMKITRGTGAPMRLIAVCPKETPSSF